MADETRVRAMTTVPLPPAEAFALFTDEVDAWWRHGPRFRPAADGKTGRMVFEPGAGGRLLEVYETGADAFELGRTLEWIPGDRLVFQMGGREFAKDEWTRVAVYFERLESGRGTRVTIEHTGFDALGSDHGVWHGQDHDAFVGMMGLWWGDLLVAFRAGNPGAQA